jgi:hypothetical protein
VTLPKPAPPQQANEPSDGQQPAAGPDPKLLSDIERAAREMADRRPRRPRPPMDLPHGPAPAETAARFEARATFTAMNLPATAATPELSAHQVAPAEAPTTTEIAAQEPSTNTAPLAVTPALPVAAVPQRAAALPRALVDDHFQLSFTAAQSAAIIVGMIALVIGAFGMAATGWVAAYHWSCRAGLTSNYCSPAPDLKPLALPEIPT